MRLTEFLEFYRKTVSGKITFEQFQSAYKTFDPDMFYADCLATNADKLKTLTRHHGSIEQMADGITGKALHFWALSFHVMYRPEIESMKDKVDELHEELTEEDFVRYVESKQKAISQ